MSKVIALFFFVLVLAGGYWFFSKDTRSQHNILSTTNPRQNTVTATPQKAFKKSLFVPYWTLGTANDFSEYDTVIYFGIAPDEEGINREDDGFVRLNTFAEGVGSGQKSLLTIRMVDQEINATAVKDASLQRKIIDDSLEIAKEYEFDGVVLDLEYSSLGFESIEKRITSFSNAFYNDAKRNSLEYYFAIYGDTYYRARPYNVRELSKNSDGLYIMAYDFHKARGNPGPNFPLQGKDTYGYDLQNLLSDFAKDSQIEKIIPVFGFFGYDWEVDKEEKASESAGALSLNKINQDVVKDCAFDECRYERNQESTEMKATYKTGEENHVVWFEDLESVARKQDYFSKKGVSHYGYWAYTFF